jgi:sugar/nucleoside kinase (ribokinase family)
MMERRFGQHSTIFGDEDLHSVYAIENPLVDYVMHENYSWLERFDAKPGTMQLVEHAKFKAVTEAARSYTTFPGGSGANTIRALAWLIGPEIERYGRPAYSGGIGDDDAGAVFTRSMKSIGVDVTCAIKSLPTGTSAIVVTPDHERTMFTYLGACRDFSREDVDYEALESAGLFYSTGYMWDTEPQKMALFEAAERANRLDIPFCLDLADPFVVDRYYVELREWIRGKVSVLFANREEMSRMTGVDGTAEEIIRSAASLAPTVVMKTGSDGCIAFDRGRLVSVPGFAVSCVDTTGAGDSFAAGYLYGMLTGRGSEACGRLGNRVASQIVAVEGCRYDLLDRDDALSVLS